jgi:hypothetical protein
MSNIVDKLPVVGEIPLSLFKNRTEDGYQIAGFYTFPADFEGGYVSQQVGHIHIHIDGCNSYIIRVDDLWEKCIKKLVELGEIPQDKLNLVSPNT